MEKKKNDAVTNAWHEHLPGNQMWMIFISGKFCHSHLPPWQVEFHIQSIFYASFLKQEL